jgi:hypothetical protein
MTSVNPNLGTVGKIPLPPTIGCAMSVFHLIISCVTAHAEIGDTRNMYFLVVDHLIEVTVDLGIRVGTVGIIGITVDIGHPKGITPVVRVVTTPVVSDMIAGIRVTVVIAATEMIIDVSKVAPHTKVTLALKVHILVLNTQMLGLVVVLRLEPNRQDLFLHRRKTTNH